MTQRITVVYLIADTVVEETLTGKRITFDRPEGRGVLVNIWRKGRRVEQISYERACRVHRILDGHRR